MSTHSDFTALDSTSIPGDHDGDGICDMKEVAVLDYGDSEIIFVAIHASAGK